MAKKSMYDDYIEYYNNSVEKYGDNVCVLYQCGDFMSMYSYDNIKPNISEPCNVMDIVLTRTNVAEPVGIKNPYMCGFQMSSMDKFIKRLLKENYTVAIVEQKPELVDGNVVRELTNVVTPATYIEDIGVSNNYIMVFYIEIHDKLYSKKKVYSVGLCAYECLKNELYTYEVISDDLYYFMNEITRFYMSYLPKELIIYEIGNDSNEKIYSNINFVKNQYYNVYFDINYNYSKIKYQNKLFEKVYNYSGGLITSIEKLCLVHNEYIRISLIILFEFINKRNDMLLKDVAEPMYFKNNNYMELYNNAQYQLSVLDESCRDNNQSYNSLNDVVNCCITQMGYDYLKMRLCSPYKNKKIINNYYKMSKIVSDSNICEDIRNILKGVYNLKKLFRKLIIVELKPMEFLKVYLSIKSSIELINKCMKHKLKKKILKIMTEDEIIRMNDIVTKMETMFDFNGFSSFCEKTITHNYLFNVGVDVDLDKMMEDLKNGTDNLMVYETVFKKICEDIVLKCNTRAKNKKYYLKISKKIGEKVHNEIKTLGGVYIDSNHFLDIKDIKFEYLKNECRITFDHLNGMSNEQNDKHHKIYNLIVKKFREKTKKIYGDNVALFENLIKLIIKMDYVCNNVYVSNKYHYIEPIIVESDNSFIDANKIRHPIIERLIDHDYTPHDLKLDNDKSGILIYGINSSGKSSLMKTAGLCIIMAQCGMYVPALEFKYSIFESLFTRITAQDNLFKGQSSYIVELVELDNILNYANNKSLVIGDEICRGTEIISATALVASSINEMINKNVKFMFATHLHKIPELNNIKDIDKLIIKHISVEIDKNDKIVYNRILHDGVGLKDYGLLVASHVLKNKHVVNRAYEYKDELQKEQKLVNTKISLYDKNTYVDKCSFCNSVDNLEVHHICHQKDFINGIHTNMDKYHLIKNDPKNLCVLCNKCHDDIHSGKKNIEKKILTSSGVSII